jgi:predicted acetylornithine/succinylornithine family transaminase
MLSQVQNIDQTYVMGTYARRPVMFVRGRGSRLWDDEGREYLDFLAGIAVCGVGHCHPHVADAIALQSATLCHVSNLHHNPLQAKLAERLCRLTGMDRAFFCNSGCEANEAAIKIARKWGKAVRGANCCEIITFTGSFHGRTLATVTATAQPKYQAPFTPLPEGFRYVEYGNLTALDDAITENTCAVMIEPLQGESGVHTAGDAFLRAVRMLCDEAEVLMICDEVQSGMGRTGRFLASQHADAVPDVVTLAKALGNGMPIGACLARGTAAAVLSPGDHGSTFGGQPLACAAAMAVLDVMEREDLIRHAEQVGTAFLTELTMLMDEYPDRIAEVRGRGLMVGVDLVADEAREVNNLLLQQGIVANATGDHTLRFLPPLVVTREECGEVVSALRKIFQQHAGPH